MIQEIPNTNSNKYGESNGHPYSAEVRKQLHYLFAVVGHLVPTHISFLGDDQK